MFCHITNKPTNKQGWFKITTINSIMTYNIFYVCMPCHHCFEENVSKFVHIFMYKTWLFLRSCHRNDFLFIIHYLRKLFKESAYKGPCFICAEIWYIGGGHLNMHMHFKMDFFSKDRAGSLVQWLLRLLGKSGSSLAQPSLHVHKRSPKTPFIFLKKIDVRNWCFTRYDWAS